MNVYPTPLSLMGHSNSIPFVAGGASRDLQGMIATWAAVRSSERRKNEIGYINYSIKHRQKEKEWGAGDDVCKQILRWM